MGVISTKEDVMRDVADLEAELALARSREDAIQQVLNEHNAPTHDVHNGGLLNYVGRTTDLLARLTGVARDEAVERAARYDYERSRQQTLADLSIKDDQVPTWDELSPRGRALLVDDMRAVVDVLHGAD